MTLAFGQQLKQWRNIRRMSQLDLGLAANVSARHVSFLETGRASPSRSMVLQLCQTLEVPLPAQNTFLHAAGFAEVYRNRGLSDQELAHGRQAIEWTLHRHDPYPAMALDKYWIVIKANHAATVLLKAVGLAEGSSLLDAMQHSELLRASISNWQEVLSHMIMRLRSEDTRMGFDDVLTKAAANLILQLDDKKLELPAGQVVLSTQYVLNGLELSLFSMLAQFNSAEDITLADLRVELMYPADEKTANFLHSLAQLEKVT